MTASKHWRRFQENISAYTFVLPALILIAIFLFYPIGYVVYLSFHKWNLLGSPEYVGLDNYRFLNDHPMFSKTVWNTVTFVGLAVPAQMALGLFLAVLINKPIVGRDVFRTVFFIPMAVSFAAAGIIFKSVFSTEPFMGMVPTWFEDLGLKFPAWQTTEGAWAMFVVVIMNTWKSTGYAMIIYLAGLQGINPDFYEAAEVDGAKGGWEMFRHITWPLLMPTTFLLLVTTTIFSFRAFEPMFVMTRGGPASATKTLVYYSYDFRQNLVGISSAASTVLLVGVLLITIAQFFINRRFQTEL